MLVDGVGSAREVFDFDPAPAATLGREQQLLWAAPGSLFVDRVADAWRRSGRVEDLADVTGPWAVVLWEPRSAEHLIVTDPIGVQPLVWTRTRTGGFVVSSWLDRLLDRPDVDDALDYEGVLFDNTHGLFGDQIRHRTRFAAVSRVPGGRAVRVRRDGSTTLEQYWDPRTLPGPDRSLTLADAADLLRERIDRAVRRLVPVDIPVGGHVSGGLDCTAVTCRANLVLAESGRSLVAGYSWAPDERAVPRFDGDERSLLDEVAAQESLPIRTVYPDESGDWFFDLDRDRYPQTTHVRERFVLPQARADGVRVMLSGWGGDELASFNGRAVLRSLARRGNAWAVWNQTTQRAKLTATGPVPLGHQLRSFAAAMFEASPDRIRDLRHPQRARERNAVDAEIDRALRAVSPLAADTRMERQRAFQRARDHHEFQLALLTGGHLQRRTEGWYQTGRLFDVFYRYPLLDLDVVTAALQLPWQAFRSHGWTRTAFRMAIEPWVPASVAWNTTKTEPALTAPPERIAIERGPLVARSWRPQDRCYQDMLELAGRADNMRSLSAFAPSPVRGRPDAAPRQR